MESFETPTGAERCAEPFCQRPIRPAAGSKSGYQHYAGELDGTHLAWPVEDPDFAVDEWRADVADGRTTLDYRAWVYVIYALPV
jgi:hypothetical protein